MAAFLASISVLIIVPIYAPIQSDASVLALFLPGQQALVSALFLVLITRRYLRIRLIYLAPIGTVVVIEILTFHVMALPFGWVGIIAAISALWGHKKN